MARSRQTRASRALIAFVVVAITLGAAFQFHRLRKAAASVPTDKPVITPAIQNTPSTVAVISPKPMVPAVSSLPATAVGLIDIATTRPATPRASQLLADGNLLATRPSFSTLAISSHALADAKTKTDAGDLISARKILNDALLSGNLSPAETDSVKKQMAQINQTLVFGPKRYADDPFGGVDSVKPGQKLSTIASENDVTWEFLLRLNGMSDARKLRAGQALKVIKGPFHVVVTKSKFTMDVYLGSPGEAGSMYVTTYPVGLGTNDSTPTGTWMVEPHHKIKHPTYYSPRGEGVIQSDDPKNPLGPFWLGLSGTDGHAVGKASYGIHGTIDPDSIGKMSSMGCIRMHNEDVAIVYELLVEGKSTIIVKD